MLEARTDAEAMRMLAQADLFLQTGETVKGRREIRVGGEAAVYSQSAMKSVEANVRRGREAMNRALLEKTSVHRAMFRQGMGWVDFVWGDEGRVTSSGKTRGSMGISHIVAERMRKDGLSHQEVIRFLAETVPEIIAKGARIRADRIGGSENLVVGLSGSEVILVKRDGGNAWILSGWKPYPDASRAASDTQNTMHKTADTGDGSVGAGHASASNVSEPSSDSQEKNTPSLFSRMGDDAVPQESAPQAASTSNATRLVDSETGEIVGRGEVQATVHKNTGVPVFSRGSDQARERALKAPGEVSRQPPGQLDESNRIPFTGNELGDINAPIQELKMRTAGSLRRRFGKDAKGNPQTKEVTVKSDGAKVIIGWQGIKNELAKTGNPVSLIAATRLDDVIQNGAYIGSERPKPERLGVKEVHFYDTPIRVGERNHVVRVTIRETNEGKRYYYHASVEESRESAPVGDSGNMPGSTLSRVPGADGLDATGFTVPQDTPSVKENDSAQNGEEYYQRGDSATPRQGSLTRGQVVNIANSTLKGMKRAPFVAVVDRVADLPFGAPADARGAYRDGTVYVVAQNAASIEGVKETVFHEVRGHFGLRGFFGNALDNALVGINNANPRIRGLADTWIANNQDVVSNLKSRYGWTDRNVRALAIEEAMAQMAESGQTITGIQRFAAAVQSLLRKMGMSRLANMLEARTDAEAMRMLAQADLFLQTGETVESRSSRETKEVQAYSRNNTARELRINSSSTTRQDAESALLKIRGKNLKNLETGIVVQINNNQATKLVSNVAAKKSVDNGFSREQHYSVVSNIENLWKHATQINERTDRNNAQNVLSIKQFAVSLTFDTGRGEPAFAIILAKETGEHGHRAYTLELQEIETLRGMLGTFPLQDNSRTPSQSVESMVQHMLNKINTDDNTPPPFSRMRDEVALQESIPQAATTLNKARAPETGKIIGQEGANLRYQVERRDANIRALEGLKALSTKELLGRLKNVEQYERAYGLDERSSRFRKRIDEALAGRGVPENAEAEPAVFSREADKTRERTLKAPGEVSRQPPGQLDEANRIAFAGDEIGSFDRPIGHLRVRAANELRKRFGVDERGNPKETHVTVKSNGDDIIIAWQGLKHGIGTTGNEISLVAVTRLDELIRNGTYIGSERDTTGGRGIKATHIYDTPVTVKDKRYTVRVLARETKEGKRYYYHASVEDIRNPIAGLSGELSGSESARTTATGGLDATGPTVPKDTPSVKEMSSANTYCTDDVFSGTHKVIVTRGRNEVVRY
ncbi:MAG: hypothetical protein LBK01_03485 [Burkholderiaceae bacterium]|jgi:hypothetical protein|nr:hypothetical protein [Burkholderiaceae bacterium]